MWLMLTCGAYSVTRRPHTPKGDPRTLHVRARRREWLDELRTRYCPDMSEPMHSDGHADYQWRCYVEPQQWALAMARIGLDAERYTNFKSASADPKLGLKNAKLRSGLVSAYHGVWSRILDAGDGTSAYDFKSGGGYNAATWSEGAGTIDICARLGHWYSWTDGQHKCKDCDSLAPTDQHGPYGDRPSKDEVEAWWAAHPKVKRPGRKAPRQRSARVAKVPAQSTNSGKGV